MRIRVVLPAPLAPSSPTTSPGPTARSTPATAVNRPKTLLTPAHSASISGIGSLQLGAQRCHAHRVLQVRRHQLRGGDGLGGGLAGGLLTGMAGALAGDRLLSGM